MTREDAIHLVESVARFHGNKDATARFLNLAPSTLKGRLASAWREYGLAPGVPNIPLPDGTRMGKATIHVRDDGSVSNVWARAHPTLSDLEAAADALVERVAGKGKKVKAPSKVQERLHEIVIGDPHAGMYAWHEETGTDYDLDTYARLHTTAPARLMKEVGNCSELALCYMGDLFHSDNERGMTERSGNVLDMDTRWSKVVGVVVDTLCHNIELACRYAPVVHVVIVPGNHDLRSSQWTQRVLAAYFRNVEQVRVVTTPRNRHYLRYGNSLLGYHHGDRIGESALQATMSQERAADWAATQHRHWRCGHWHRGKRYRPHWDRAEAPGVDVEYFPVLAGLEAYAAQAGHFSRRAMLGIVHDPEHGEVCRHTITEGML